MKAQNSSDRELLNSYLLGNKSAISTLIEKHNRRVRDYIRMMVGDSDIAADIAQETFIKAVSWVRIRRQIYGRCVHQDAPEGSNGHRHR